MNVAGQIREFIQQEIAFGDDLVTITLETPLYEGIIDSLALMELVSFLEKRFAIIIDEEDLSSENFRTVAAIAHLVDARKGAA